MILGGDIGGTNTRLLLAPPDGSPRAPIRTGRFRSHEHDSFPAILDAFLGDDATAVTAAAFGVAGPVIDGRVDATNLDWDVDRGEIAAHLGLPVERVALLNDLESTGHGVALLDPGRLETLVEGDPDARGHAALVAAGTGLGMGILARRDDGVRPLPSEGGHAEIAPRGEEELALVRFLTERYGAATWERAVSGPGLKNLYDFVVERGDAPPSLEVARRIVAADAPRVVSAAALAEECRACEAALRLFCRLYAAAAQTLSLMTLATGGLYVGGGISPKILPALRDGTFAERFRTHPTMAEVLEEVPIRVILEEDTSLWGATSVAAALGADRRA